MLIHDVIQRCRVFKIFFILLSFTKCRELTNVTQKEIAAKPKICLEYTLFKLLLIVAMLRAFYFSTKHWQLLSKNDYVTDTGMSCEKECSISTYKLPWQF